MNIKKRYKIPIVSKGEFPHFGMNIIQVIDDKALDAIVKNTNATLSKSNRLLADFDHYSELGGDVKNSLAKLGVQLPTNAAGWIESLYRDGDTVYGNMISTPEGEKSIDSETYCKTSPVFRVIDCEFVGKNKVRPLKVKSVALTNKPNMAALGNILKNMEVLMNGGEDLQAVLMGSSTMEILIDKEKIDMKKDELKIENSETLEAAKVEAIEAVTEAVAEAVADIVDEPEVIQAVIESAQEAAIEAVEEVAEVATEEAEAEPAPEVETAPDAELEAANAKIAELSAKVAELEALLEDAGKKREEAELQNRISAELAKYPTLQNREESAELLRKDFALGAKFLASLKASFKPATIQNRVPVKTPQDALQGMTPTQRIRFKMFGR